MVWKSNPEGVSFSSPVQTGPGAHPASYTMGIGLLPGVKRPGRGVNYPPPSSAEVKERVELYLCFRSGPSWPLLGRILHFPFYMSVCPYQWPSSLRKGSSVFRVQIPPGARMSVSCECCVFSVKGLCDGLIPRPEESYRLWCAIMCDLETSRMRWPWPALGCCGRAGRNK